jgi:hypothetical protein
VAKGLPLSGSELQLLESLVRHKIRFMIVGLSAAALQGAPVVTEDVDLWFEDLSDPRLSAALREIGAAYVPPFGLNPPMLAGPGSAPFDVVIRMDGLGQFAEELKHACVIRIGKLRLPVLSLKRILTSKIAANRSKDRLVIPVLRNALRTLETKRRPTKGRASRRRAAKRRSVK